MREPAGYWPAGSRFSRRYQASSSQNPFRGRREDDPAGVRWPPGCRPPGESGRGRSQRLRIGLRVRRRTGHRPPSTGSRRYAGRDRGRPAAGTRRRHRSRWHPCSLSTCRGSRSDAPDRRRSAPASRSDARCGPSSATGPRAVPAARRPAPRPAGPASRAAAPPATGTGHHARTPHRPRHRRTPRSAERRPTAPSRGGSRPGTRPSRSARSRPPPGRRWRDCSPSSSLVLPFLSDLRRPVERR